MVAQAPLRYPFLRQLSLKKFGPPLSSESVNQLVEILTHASRLEILHLSCFDLLSSEHRLQTACSSLTSIKEFYISWSGGPVSWAKDPLHKMVTQMQSPLVKAELRFFGSDDGIRPDPAVLLHHSSTTLEDLTIWGAAFQSELLFPRMRKLLTFGLDYLPLGLIARNFPSLIDLTAVSNNYRGDDLIAADHQYRQLNRSLQLAGDGWTSLDRLAGRAADLYKLGLTCQIHRVEIFHVNSCTREMVAHILSDSRPSHVHIVLYEIFPCVLCLPDEVAARLTYLRCTIELAYFDGDSSALVSAIHYAPES
ncbi:hypothetical protein A0H81_08843 [Grifola frondosa]|uniref:F-box domain-containing protein n=1 Tax=Grifola frondosa TaxID=5627 RepID=A0A1C7M4R6_GRIFR|nr:hypothetical protein A0H81_08843 [Grifola frondosa]